MEAKQAIQVAKHYITSVLEDEGVTNLGFEGIERDAKRGVWDVTVGFSRPWNIVRNAVTALTGQPATGRTYRVVRVRDADGEVVSVKKRPRDAD